MLSAGNVGEKVVSMPEIYLLCGLRIGKTRLQKLFMEKNMNGLYAEEGEDETLIQNCWIWVNDVAEFLFWVSVVVWVTVDIFKEFN